MNVRCGSCGWTNDVVLDRDASETGARHLITCPKRDVLTCVPWWTILDGAFEVSWSPLDVNEPYELPTVQLGAPSYRVVPTCRHRFTPLAERELIGVTG